ncbi:hypothetical protein YC2023_000624 [Brassica napus]
MISRPPWPLLDDSIGEISSRQSSGVRVGFIVVAVSLLDMQESLSVSSTTLRLRDSLALLDGSESLSVSSTTPPLSYSPRWSLMPFDSDQISSDEVLSWVMLSLLDACSLRMSTVNLNAFDGDLIRLEGNA